MVVVIGGGVTGAAVSYYLSKISRGKEPVTIIDAVDKPWRNGSSLGAGAFLAESWGDGSRTEALHRRSFAMHARLAKELGLTSYAEIPVFGVKWDEQANTNDATIPWLAGTSHAPLPGRSAQVDPTELVGRLSERAIEMGAREVTASVTGLQIESNQITAIVLNDGEDIHKINGEDTVCFALGPWSSRLEDWLNIPTPIEGIWSTSCLWEPQSPETDANVMGREPTAIFCEEDTQGCHLEVLPRADNSLYVSGCGLSRVLSPSVMRSSEAPKPGDTNRPDPSRVAAACRSLDALYPGLTSGKPPDITRACIRPVSADGVPIVGRIPGVENAMIATGGGPWGITFGPVIGHSVARLLLDDDPPISLRDLNPRRFDTPIYRTLLKQRGKQAMGKSIGEQY